jgi:NAD-dependent deacetylase
MNTNDLEKVRESLKESRKVMVISGAGISAESGVPTFRGKDGLWRNYNAMELATPEAFARDPKLVWEWYNWRRELISKCSPNPAHITLAEIEKSKDEFLIVTQNVDGLHRIAGSKNIVEIHGNIWHTRCTKEHKVFENTQVPIYPIPPMCECGAMLRPHIVWFGEMLPMGEFGRAEHFLGTGGLDVLLVIGTSALFPYIQSWAYTGRQMGALVVEINLEPSPISEFADISLIGKAGEIMPRIWEE